MVLGGPPCQGFSTAGNRRSMDDDRNWLFRQYKKVLQEVGPTAFVFENVTGLLNMDGGRVFEMVRSELLKEAKSLSAWKLRAEQYAIPQRRTRVILVGSSQPMSAPPLVTELEAQSTLFGALPLAVTVSEALSDLPPLIPGEDGSAKDYLCQPQSPYQQFMRGESPPMNISPHSPKRSAHRRPPKLLLPPLPILLGHTVRRPKVSRVLPPQGPSRFAGQYEPA